MRKIAWALTLLLFLVSAVLFLRYLAIYAMLGDPRMIRDARVIAGLAHLASTLAGEAVGMLQATRSQADFSLYASIATALVAALSCLILAATRTRKGSAHLDGDAGSEDDAETCPECGERISGMSIVCRGCGYRFGPRTWR